jgi:hypothetical protein
LRSASRRVIASPREITSATNHRREPPLLAPELANDLAEVAMEIGGKLVRRLEQERRHEARGRSRFGIEREGTTRGLHPGGAITGGERRAQIRDPRPWGLRGSDRCLGQLAWSCRHLGRVAHGRGLFGIK